jgi:hypothetical protein
MHCLKTWSVNRGIFLYYVSENQHMSRNDQESVSILSSHCEKLMNHLHDNVLSLETSRAIAQAVSRWLPTAAARVVWNLWWTKRHWGKFSPGNSVSLVKHSTDCSTLIIAHYLELVQ